MQPEKRNKSNAIYDYLLEYMQDQHLIKGDRLPTEATLTEMFDVSRITVQKALSKLLEQNYLYRKRGSGTYVTGKHNSMSNGGINIVPLVIAFDGVTSRGFEVIKGVESYLNEHGFYLTIHTSNGDADYEKDMLQELAEKFDSILVMPSDSAHNKELYMSLLKRQKNLVFIDHTINGLNVNYVASDNIYGGYLAAKYLYDLGHRRVLCVSPGKIDQFSSFKSRLQGYKNVLEELKIPFDPSLVYEYCEGDKYASVIQYLRAFSPEERPTGIFIFNDLGASELLDALEKNGFSVPGDFDIVGYDNLETFMKKHTEVATIDQDFYRMGYTAAQILFSKMSREDDSITVRKLPVRLVEKKVAET